MLLQLIWSNINSFVGIKEKSINQVVWTIKYTSERE